MDSIDLMIDKGNIAMVFTTWVDYKEDSMSLVIDKGSMAMLCYLG